MLGASSCETARILLMSKSSAFPDGLANSSGQVGRNLMDTPSVSIKAQIPQLEGLPAFNDEGVTLFHVYAPWWLYREQSAGQLDFARAYHFDFWGGRRMPEFDDMVDLAALSRGYGARLHADMRRLYGSIVYMTGRGEMVPNADSYMTLDPHVRDRWGLPVPRFSWRWGEQEIASCRHQRKTIVDIFQGMGAKILSDIDTPMEAAMRPGGHVIHETGTARMSGDPRQGVLDAHGRCWDVPNLYVVDGAAFASMPDKNPTLTIMALAWRAAEHLVDALVKGDA